MVVIGEGELAGVFEHVGVGAAELEDNGAFDGVVVLEETVAAFGVVVEGVCCVWWGEGGGDVR